MVYIMFSNNSTLNQQILDKEKMWFSNLYIKLIHRSKNEGSIVSNPFIYGEANIDATKKKVMIIGQEARGYNEFRGNLNFYEEQEYTKMYLERQVYGLNSYKYNKSPFWDFHRFLKNNNYFPMWNNLDKAHLIVNSKTHPLTVEYEKILNSDIGNGRSLLQEEIQISKPKIVVFVTGPNYWESMASALHCDSGILYENKPNTKKYVSDITSIAKLGIRCIWTYHPNFIRRSGYEKSILDDVLKRIDV